MKRTITERISEGMWVLVNTGVLQATPVSNGVPVAPTETPVPFPYSPPPVDDKCCNIEPTVEVTTGMDDNGNTKSIAVKVDWP